MLRQGKLGSVAYAQVNYDEQQNVAKRLLKGSSIPQLVVYFKTHEGWRSEHLVGSQSEVEVTRLIQRAVVQAAARPAPNQQAAVGR
jgi:hypothetical protein